jgi:hypothetical protein
MILVEFLASRLPAYALSEHEWQSLSHPGMELLDTRYVRTFDVEAKPVNSVSTP